MTTPVAEDKRGFDVEARFYPYIPLDQWLNQDFVLARTLTRVGIDDLVSGKADYLAVQQALVAVALWHAHPEQTMDRIITRVGLLNPSAITEVGFDDAEDEEVPLDVDASATQSSSAESGTASSESS